MITADTSVVVAAFASWHEAHASSNEAVRECERLPAHVLVETYSVLTRLPPPHRAEASVVAEYLRRRFPGPALQLSARSQPALLAEAAKSGVSGGAIYDALIAGTAHRAGATLVTRDSRAIPTYELLGIDFEVVV